MTDWYIYPKLLTRELTDIAEELTVGQAVEAKILDIDTERKRISLSLKQAMQDTEEDFTEEAEEYYPEEDEEFSEE